jgi:hypothetical protein
MTSPKQPGQPYPLPKEEQEKTYSEQLDKLKCVCAVGAQIRPITLPSSTINLGDIIAGHASALSTFTAMYSAITVILKMISCIIDVLCSITNPFALVAAMVKLFGTCLPDFLLLFPQLALPAIIICMLKIVLAILEYVMSVLAPLFADIFKNISDLVNAFTTGNQDSVDSISFKIAALVKEILNSTGILAVLGGLYVMVQSLIKAAIALPCSGACSGCGDTQCNDTIRQTSIDADDGMYNIIYNENGYDYELFFSSLTKAEDFKNIIQFFPIGLDYFDVKRENIPFILTDSFDNSFIVKNASSDGVLQLQSITPEFNVDGFLSNTDMGGLPYSDLKSARFTTSIDTFDTAFVNRYIKLQDTRDASDAVKNTGTWKIMSYYDGYNVLLTKDTDWGFPSVAGTIHLRWFVVPSSPNESLTYSYSIEINHDELIRHSLIGVGCHPAIKASRDGAVNRYPDLNVSLPDLPDYNKLINDVNNCLNVPANIDTAYVLDNYETLGTNLLVSESCINNTLGDFSNQLKSYVSNIYPSIFDPEGTLFSAIPETQIVGKSVRLSLLPYDRNGEPLGKTVPSGIVEVEFENDFGEISDITTVEDSGEPTGEYIADITSFDIGVVNIKAKVGGRYVSDYDGAQLIPRTLSVEFIKPEVADDRNESIGSVKQR